MTDFHRIATLLLKKLEGALRPAEEPEFGAWLDQGDNRDFYEVKSMFSRPNWVVVHPGMDHPFLQLANGPVIELDTARNESIAFQGASNMVNNRSTIS